ncbi:hypothetical protein A0H81_09752 [Grifola frondosa]|uniref:Uncharacterized protein n=1 Tax=Grifola frondosa TaxID=5627 RepID=A0A1C7M043_GRIFR|nr:hypothetical protein A0H81_09752 [Grifola frondosa]
MPPHLALSVPIAGRRCTLTNTRCLRINPLWVLVGPHITPGFTHNPLARPDTPKIYTRPPKLAPDIIRLTAGGVVQILWVNMREEACGGKRRNARYAIYVSNACEFLKRAPG